MTKALRVPYPLCHILNAIEPIGRSPAHMDEAGFLANELVQDAVIRNIDIMGEAANNLQRVDAAFAAHHAETPSMVMYTMRNRVTHGYAR